MSKCITAFTKPGNEYPGYVNITDNGDGTVTVIVRGEPKIRDGNFVCGYPSDRGKAGRCTPGDVFCNNYCNMAPEKGPMQKAPNPCRHVDEGPLVSITISHDAYQQMRKDMDLLD